MPIIETQFSRVSVDLVGPIHPATDRGNRYILTMVDYATRYPEIPLKDIQTETVAEAMVNMFTRVGVPKEILSDQGSQVLPRNAMLSVVYAIIVCLSVFLHVCVSVCVSVTLQYCIKTAKRRITKIMQHDSSLTLVF